MADDPGVTSEHVRILTIITIGFLLFTSIVCSSIVAIMTDRILARVVILIFAGMVLLAGFGGVSWWSLRREHRWRFNVERNGHDDPA